VRPVRLGRQVEVALGQAVHLVRPDLDLALSPGDVEVRVVALGLGDRPHLVGELQRPDEIRELIESLQVALGAEVPPGLELVEHLLDLRPRQRGDAPAAGHAGFICETHHRSFAFQWMQYPCLFPEQGLILADQGREVKAHGPANRILQPDHPGRSRFGI